MQRRVGTGRKTSTARPVVARLAAILALVSCLAVTAAEAQNTHRRSSGSQPGAAGHRSTRSVPGTVHQPNRYLLPPAGLGSAANAPPGFYRQLDAPRRAPRAAPHAGRGPAYLPYPYVVYVESPAYATSPPQYEPPPPRDTAPPPAPAPQPIYIVQQPPAAAAPSPPPRPAPEKPAPPAPAKSREPVAVSFSIRPADAAVYLDDELLGAGGELTARETAMRLHPGVYVLEVEHPDHPPQRLVFGISSGDPIEVAVDLTADRAGRRSRIR